MQKLFGPLWPMSLLLFPSPVLAQIIPDRTLGPESSVVSPTNIKGLESDIINGGAIRGTNLLHSFQEFNVNEGRGAYFANPPQINNIFTRITGNNSTKIFGRLGVLGGANLFLLNPNGIIFGPQAQLDLKGSFIATSADSVIFDNGLTFSASNQNTALLTINIPIGLQFRENPQPIINQSQVKSDVTLPPLSNALPFPASDLAFFNNTGLQVAPGQTLALIGGDIKIDRSYLTANSGQVVLGSVQSPGMVMLEATPSGLNFNYDQIQKFGNIELFNALINTSGLGGDRIEMRGHNIDVIGSALYSFSFGPLDGLGISIKAHQLRLRGGSQIYSVAGGTGKSSPLNIQATDLVEITGPDIAKYQQYLSNYLITGQVEFFDTTQSIATTTLGSNHSSDININTDRLILQNGSIFGSSTFSLGDIGNITLNVTKLIELSHATITSSSARSSKGLGGDLVINTPNLILRESASISSLTTSKGASGNIIINAPTSVQLLSSPEGSTIQNIIATNSIDGTGRAGNITVNTQDLILAQGSGLSSSSGSTVGENILSDRGGEGGNISINATNSVNISGVSGNLRGRGISPSLLSSATTTSSKGGDIRIVTPFLVIKDGGGISTASTGNADAGSISINAEQVQVMGKADRYLSTIDASVGRIFLENPNATANAGSLNLMVNQLEVKDQGVISVNSLGRGSAGNLTVKADSIALENGSSIDGRTASGSGANINLTSPLIQLRKNSNITTDAGNADGGNININSNFLLAFPQGRSDITANARTARGGQINLNVRDIFGFQLVTKQQIQNSLGISDEAFANLTVNPTNLLPTNDIAAISQSTGAFLQGTVIFNPSSVNPSHGLIILDDDIKDIVSLISNDLCSLAASSEFIVTGKGGIASNPTDLFNGRLTEFTWVQPSAVTGVFSLPSSAVISGKLSPNQTIIPAQGWVMNDRGKVTLVADQSNHTNHHLRSWHPVSQCR